MCALPSMVPSVREPLTPEAIGAHWSRTSIGRAQVELDGGLRLRVYEAAAGRLSLAQFDDCTCRPREGYLWTPPLLMEARACFSHPGGEFAGTAGFGFWNNPAPFWSTRVETAPRWVWFYYASPDSTFSLMPGPPHGFKAAVVHGGKAGRPATGLLGALLKAPPGVKAGAATPLPTVEMTLAPELMAGWHTYRIAWLPDRIVFQVDGLPVLETRHVPAGPLAFVAWIDNNYAAFDAWGRMGSGQLAIDRPQWLALEALSFARP